VVAPGSAAGAAVFDTPGAAIADALAKINTANPATTPLVVSTIQRSDTFAIAYLRLAVEPAEYPEIKAILATYSPTQGWAAFAPGLVTNEQYNQVLASFPPQLMDEPTKSYLSLVTKKEVSIQSVAGHKLPWQNLTTAGVSQKDGATHMNQIDFTIQNDGVYASKPGTVLYIKESSPNPPAPECNNDGVTWRKGNYVVIKHSATDYTWYVHLAYNSVPVQVGDAVGFGTRIGTEGRTGFTCGLTGIHLHFMASTWAPTTFPDPSVIDAAAWPLADSITNVNFTETSWASIVVGSTLTSQNVGVTNPTNPLPANAVFCSTENALCNFDGIGTVYYGADQSYNSISNVKMSTECTTTMFGDPAPGSAKQCYVVITAPAPSCPTVTTTARLFDSTACGSSSINAAVGLTKLEANNFNDIAESLALPSGWSIRLFKNNSETLADSLCVTASDKNLNDNTYQSGSLAGNSATWVRVYSNTNCSITTSPAAPGNFGKSAPANGASGLTTSPTLTWAAASNAAGYDYCIDTTNDNACATWISKGTTPSKTLSGLLPNQTYYWQVRATNSGGSTYADSSPSAFWSFTTAPLAADFSKTSPANGSSGNSLTPTLKWAAMAGATKYELCYAASSQAPCASWISAGTSTSKAISGLAPQTQYAWQVRATTPAGILYANASTAWVFTTALTKPTKPTNFNASDGAYSDKVLLTWDATAGATSYRLYRSTSSTLPSAYFANNIIATSYTDTTAVAGKTYTYWLKACNSIGCGSPSTANTGYAKTSSSPDLIIKSIITSPLNPSLGQLFNVVVKVKNQGTASSPAFRLIFTMDAAPTACPATGAGYYDIPSLAAGTAAEFTFTARFDSGANHNLYAMADSKCQVSETIETNNTFGPVPISLGGVP
jgi:murein DD-endopeptidase MepM/ murein hydrolase activator NlpD